MTDMNTHANATNTLPAKIAFVVLIATFIASSLLLALAPDCLHWLCVEDSVAETLSAVLFLLTGGVLLLAARTGDVPRVARVLLVLAGIAFLLAAGEEVSWGQRVFSWGTPDYLLEVNEQDETNLHNIDKKLFDRLYDRGILVLWLATCACFVLNKRTLLGLRPLSLLIVFCFASLCYVRELDSLREIGVHHVLYAVSLLLLVPVFVRSRDTFMIVAGAALLVSMATLTSWNLAFQANFHGGNTANELREFLFAVCSLAAAAELHTTTRVLLGRSGSRPRFTRRS